MTLQCVPTVPQTPAKLRYKALSAPDFVLDKGLLNPIPPLNIILYRILGGSFVYSLEYIILEEKCQFLQFCFKSASYF